MEKLVIIRGAGELATGIAHRLFNAGYKVMLLEKEYPSAIRRNIVFAEAVYDGRKEVERVSCTRVSDSVSAVKMLKENQMVIAVDPEGKLIGELEPDVVVDAMYAKRNLGTSRNMAPLTIGIGPGFIAGKDVDCVIETVQGHNLGRIIREGMAMPEQETIEVRASMKSSHTIIAPCAGHLEAGHPLSFVVKKDETITKLVKDDGTEFEVKTPVAGVLRGLLHDGCPVKAGLKIAEVDPSTKPANCFTISAKSRCVSGSVLEAVMSWERTYMRPRKRNFLGFKRSK